MNYIEFFCHKVKKIEEEGASLAVLDCISNKVIENKFLGFSYPKKTEENK